MIKIEVSRIEPNYSGHNGPAVGVFYKDRAKDPRRTPNWRDTELGVSREQMAALISQYHANISEGSLGRDAKMVIVLMSESEFEANLKDKMPPSPTIEQRADQVVVAKRARAEAPYVPPMDHDTHFEVDLEVGRSWESTANGGEERREGYLANTLTGSPGEAERK